MKKFATFFVLAASMIIIAAPAQAYTPGTTSTGLYRLRNNKTGEHFYTTDYKEAFALAKIDYNQSGFASHGDYTLEGVEGKVFSAGFYNQTPLYRLYNPKTDRHFYTTSDTEVSAVEKQGFVMEGTIGYLASTNDSPDGGEIVSFYRLYNKKLDDHFYTKNSDEANAAIQSGYVSEGIMGYISK